ncbi:MAG TPA: flagellar biosynthetic protein FliO [Bacteroidota bacterium]|nr:flagellar biosynthetic protein FliO [Bacteroidota bacterium]
MGWVLLKTLASLGAVLGLMAALVLFMKKYLYGYQASSSSLVSVDVLGQRLIQPKRSVVVVKVLNKIFILGMTEEGMTTLGEIQDPDILHWLDTNMAEAETAKGRMSSGNISPRQGDSFGEYLARNIGFVRPKGRRRGMERERTDVAGDE